MVNFNEEGGYLGYFETRGALIAQYPAPSRGCYAIVGTNWLVYTGTEWKAMTTEATAAAVAELAEAVAALRTQVEGIHDGVDGQDGAAGRDGSDGAAGRDGSDGADAPQPQWIYRLGNADDLDQYYGDELTGYYNDDPNYQNDNYVPQYWSATPPSVSSTNRYRYDAVRYKINGVWGAYVTPYLTAYFAQDGQDGADGSDGEDGAAGRDGLLMRPRGQYDSNATYNNDSNYVDVVYTVEEVDGENVVTWWVSDKEKRNFSGHTPGDATDPGWWVASSVLIDFGAFDWLLANNATIGGFSIGNNKLQSSTNNNKLLLDGGNGKIEGTYSGDDSIAYQFKLDFVNRTLIMQEQNISTLNRTAFYLDTNTLKWENTQHSILLRADIGGIKLQYDTYYLTVSDDGIRINGDLIATRDYVDDAISNL